MQEYVLFSPVGTTDPMGINKEIATDGPMIRICRIYRPKKVYLFFSKEMAELKENDIASVGYDRYNHCLDRLCEDMGVSIDREERIDKNCEEVQRFDLFIEPFTRYLTQIHQRHPDKTVLVNISSGSPAMKSCLLFLSKFLPFEIRAIQVSNPAKAAQREPRKIELIDGYWNDNRDRNAPDFAPDDEGSRCIEENYPNTLARITKESVCRHIDSFDYEAAIREAATIPEFVSDRARNLLFGAKERIRLNPERLYPLLSSEEQKAVFPVRQSDFRQLFEYLCWLKMKLDRNDLADFVRGITPAIYNLSLTYLRVCVGIDLRKYAGSNDWLSRDGLNNDTKGREILKHLDHHYPKKENGKIVMKNGKTVYSEFKDGYIKSEDCIYLITVFGTDNKVNGMFSELREFETGVRHKIAHDIVSISLSSIKTASGIKAEGVLERLMALASRTVEISEQDWDCYVRMNELLKIEVKTGV